MEYEVRLLAQQKNIAIMRVENGWLIRTNDGLRSLSPSDTPLQVAETAERLAELVSAWANQQQGA